MRKKMFFFLIFLNISVFAQLPTASRYEIELFIVIENVDYINGVGIFFELESVQPFVYENEVDRYVFNFSTKPSLLSTKYLLGAPGNPVDPILITENSTYPNNRKWGGFNFISGSAEQDKPFGDFAYGVYKLTACRVSEIEGDYYTSELGGSFYIDMRDSKYPHIAGELTRNNDFFFKYDCATESFTTSGFNEPTYPSGFTTSIQENKILRIWELDNFSAADNSLFPTSFWSNVLISFIDQGTNPYLVWSSYPGEYVSYYKIYKKKNSPEFTLHATTINLYYEDSSEILYAPGLVDKSTIQYYVTAVYGQQSVESDASNSINVTIGDYPFANKIKSDYVIKNNTHSTLAENYPNPFNPTTNISYSIPANNFVSLKVYDSIGKAVAELVNEIQGAGNYTIPFDGRNLSSGVYYYVLSTPNYWKVKKMLLIR